MPKKKKIHIKIPKGFYRPIKHKTVTPKCGCKTNEVCQVFEGCFCKCHKEKSQETKIYCNTCKRNRYLQEGESECWYCYPKGKLTDLLKDPKILRKAAQMANEEQRKMVYLAEILKIIDGLIVDEILICQHEGTPTSRLTSLAMNIKKKFNTNHGN